MMFNMIRRDMTHLRFASTPPRQQEPAPDFEEVLELACVEKHSVEMKPVRELHLERPTRPGMPSFLSSASGVTEAGNFYHVIADDGLHLGVFPKDSEVPGHLIKLLERPDLPLDEKERKALKPDLEASALVKTSSGTAILAVGSGSTERRNTGVLVPLDAEGQPGTPKEFDLTPLYEDLRQRYPELNIEGLSPVGDRLRLLQRGNGTPTINGVIDLDLKQSLEAIESGKPLGPELIRSVKQAELGTIEGHSGPVPWTFTDLAPLEGERTIFTAAAEDTDNPYEDGEVLGSAVGILEADGTVSSLYKLDRRVKVEGVEVNGGEATLVTDADDPHRPGQMFRITLPRP